MAPTVQGKVVKVLREIAQLLQLKGENAFKSRAYEIAADRIAGLTEDLTQRVAEGTLTQLPGIGEAISQKITELVTTGRLEYYERLRAEYPPGVFALLKVPELGPRKVQALWKELQVQDLTTLEAACRDGRVRGLKGFGPKSEEKILSGLELLRRTSLSDRVPLARVLPVADAVLTRIRAAPGVRRVSVGGSVRRFCETVADVDFIASAPDAGPVFAALTSFPEVTEVIAQGESKCSVRLGSGLQCDLRVLPDGDYATALHHFTGSKAHHIRLRSLAADRGLKISEWGVHRGDEKLDVPTEEALYGLLGMQYVPPELREDAGEVEAALTGALPQDLITEDAIVGAVHNHSTWSDGRNSLEEMALAARARGLRYLTVTEHSQTASYAGGLKLEDLERQWDEIDAVNEAVDGITLLKGIETDILATGALDYPEQVLERLDVVIGSIHERHKMDADQMTERVLRAFEHPLLQIWGHPTGRLIGKREPYGLRMEEILDRAAERGIVLEVNGNPERLDLSAEHVRMALRRGIRLVVSTDAHSVGELDHVRFAVGTARKGGARRGEVLNCLPAGRFVAELRGRRG